jgi:hypothetical protein
MNARRLILLLLPLLLFSCKDKNSTFRLEGEFRHMNQAEFFLFDPVNGKKDTISVVRGRFVYEKVEQDTAMLLLMYPNYSLLPVFAYKGISLKLKGDASHLKEAELKGSEENDEMTAFRLRAAKMTPPEELDAARKFITENPASPISLYLLRHYFVESLEPNYDDAYYLCRLMMKATPRNKPLQQLHQQLKVLAAGNVGSKMPVFVLLDNKKRLLTNEQFHRQANVVCLWSSWNSESRQLVSAVHKLQKKYPEKIALIAISIDATRQEGFDWLRRDSISDFVIHDGRMWHTPLAVALGMTTVPSNIIADRNGRIIARDLLKKEQLEKEIEKILK